MRVVHVDLEIEMTEEEYSVYSQSLEIFCYSLARSRCEPGACHCGERMDITYYSACASEYWNADQRRATVA